MHQFEPISQEIRKLVDVWIPMLEVLNEQQISGARNSQNRNIRQIIGHMCDSASNNTHRTVHLQYQKSPLDFPNYATHGNNDRWIAVQNYETENWMDLIHLWKYLHLHIAHVFLQVDTSKLNQVWNAGEDAQVTLEEGITDFPRHMKLHLAEIEELLK